MCGQDLKYNKKIKPLNLTCNHLREVWMCLKVLTKHKEWVELYMFSFMLVKISSIISSNKMLLNIDVIASLDVTDSKKCVKLELVSIFMGRSFVWDTMKDYF